MDSFWFNVFYYGTVNKKWSTFWILLLRLRYGKKLYATHSPFSSIFVWTSDLVVQNYTKRTKSLLLFSIRCDYWFRIACVSGWLVCWVLSSALCHSSSITFKRWLRMAHHCANRCAVRFKRSNIHANTHTTQHFSYVCGEWRYEVQSRHISSHSHHLTHSKWYILCDVRVASLIFRDLCAQLHHNDIYIYIYRYLLVFLLVFFSHLFPKMKWLEKRSLKAQWKRAHGAKPSRLHHYNTNTNINNI